MKSAFYVIPAQEGKVIHSGLTVLLQLFKAHGTIAALPTAAPHACVALWDACKAGDHATALDLHEKLLKVWQAIEADNLPACTKYALTLQGCPAGLPRPPMHAPSEAQKRNIRAALEAIGATLQQAA